MIPPSFRSPIPLFVWLRPRPIGLRGSAEELGLTFLCCRLLLPLCQPQLP